MPDLPSERRAELREWLTAVEADEVGTDLTNERVVGADGVLVTELLALLDSADELDDWKGSLERSRDPHPCEQHCACVPHLNGALNRVEDQRDAALRLVETFGDALAEVMCALNAGACRTNKCEGCATEAEMAYSVCSGALGVDYETLFRIKVKGAIEIALRGAEGD